MNNIKRQIIPANPGFMGCEPYADPDAPGGVYFYEEPIVAWDIEDDSRVIMTYPVCVDISRDDIEFIRSPDGMYRHCCAVKPMTKQEAIDYYKAEIIGDKK